MAIRKISADSIHTITNGVIENGVLVMAENGTILEIGDRKNYDVTELEIYNGIICPGFINAHCHLELSHLKNKIIPKTGLVNFVEQLMKIRFEIPIEQRLQAIESAEIEMVKNGIVAIGDISNETISIQPKSKQNLFYHTFIETLGLNPSIAKTRFEDAVLLQQKFENENLQNSIAPHAPYSTSIELINLILNQNKKTTIHNQESIAEALFFMNKSGDFIDFYKRLNLNINYFKPTAVSSLQTILNNIIVDQNILFVHNTFTEKSDFDVIKKSAKNSFLCACPSANLFIENTLPNYKLWFDEFEQICIGTDSLASNNSLSIWDEINVIRNNFSNISLEQLLKCATYNGAKFLEIDNWAGSFEIGKTPGLNLISEGNCTPIF
jgi:cytosine/adenosine deaminase-related metal-dependent hydrolase